MKKAKATLNVGWIALGFAAAALIVMLPMWLGGGMFYDGGMFHGSGMMGQGTMLSNGGIVPIVVAVLFVTIAAIIGALVAIVYNNVARK